MWLKKFSRALLGTLGTTGILIAVFAHQIGLDKNSDWGAGRIILFAAGIAILIFVFRQQLRHIFRPGTDLIRRSWQKHITKPVNHGIENLKAGRIWGMVLSVLDRIRSSLLFQRLVGFRGKFKAILTGILFIGLGAFYLWVVTSGTWVILPKASSNYNKLADAFIHGQLSLLEKPSAELLALENPYSLQQRLESGASYPSDVTLYGGKFYIYWGPAPALIFYIIKQIIPIPLRDVYLVIGFLFAMVLEMAFLWKRMENRFHRKSRWGTFLLFVLTAGLIIPIPYLLARPGTYEASIAGGQFFTMSALVSLFLAFENPRSTQKKWLAIASTAIILAVGSRVSLAFALLFLSGMAAVYLFFSRDQLRSRLLNILIFILPQAVGSILILWYNQARFDSCWEFGMRYALSVTDMPTAAPFFLHLSNVIPNLYQYVFRLPEFSLRFPYLSVAWVETGSWPFFMEIPPTYYFSEPVAGLLFLTPMAVFFWYPCKKVYSILMKWKGMIHKKTAIVDDPDRFKDWWLLTLVGISFITFFTVLTFFASTMRYMMDFIPVMILVTFFGFRMIGSSKRTRPGISFIFTVLCLVTILAGILLSFSGPNNHLLNDNPNLYGLLEQSFNRMFNP